MSGRPSQIVLGVTGSIAAYKAVHLLRLLIREAYDVHVILTPAGRRFVGEMTWQALSGRPVRWDQFATGDGSSFSHLELAGGDLLVIAPATAGTIGKMASGLADNLLLATYLAADCPVVVCPAMNHNMWNHPAVKENIQTLKRRGVKVIAPGRGELACGEEGEGRLEDPEAILAVIKEILQEYSQQDLAGRNILITAGATREPIDAVRFISNRSSGKMGFALAEAARRRGASVAVIAANCFLQRDAGVRYIDVSTSEEMAKAINQEFDQSEVLIMAAAVADYKVSSEPAMGKIERKEKNDLHLVPTSDILSSLKAVANGRLKVGFAAEFGTKNLNRARRKLREKDLDMIVYNDISRSDIGFESDENEVVIITHGREDVFVGKAGKLSCANRILDQIQELL